MPPNDASHPEPAAVTPEGPLAGGRMRDPGVEAWLKLIQAFIEGSPRAELPAESAWPQLREGVRRNRGGPVLAKMLEGRTLPSEAEEWLKASCRTAFAEVVTRCTPLHTLASALAEIPWCLLRGPVLGVRLYGDLFLRPFGDLDVLVPEDRVEAALRALDAAGLVRPPGALSDAYYRRYHLHVQRDAPGAARPVLVEVHWALDHPYTLYTPDLPGILRRSEGVRVHGTDVRMPCGEDLVVLLAMHTLKHSVWLPLWVEQGAVRNVIDRGELPSLLDLALACRRIPGLDWAGVRERAGAWGAAGALKCALDAVEQLWPGLLPAEMRESLPPLPTGRWRRWWAEHESLPGRLLGRSRSGAVFRGVRALDAIEYVCPPSEYLVRRYGAGGLACRARHTCSAVMKLGSNAAALWGEQRRRTPRR